MVTDSATKNKELSLSRILAQRAKKQSTWLTVGLDPDLRRLPQGIPPSPAGVVEFCRSIIATTEESALAFKINFAFFEQLGPSGWEALYQVRESIPPHIPTIADAKRGDIGNTSSAYAAAIFTMLKFDAVTVNPYLGWDSLQPFVNFAEKAIFVLCRTSNPGASDIQEAMVNGDPFYIRIAKGALRMPARADVGLVVGATQPESARAVRALSQDVLLLMPGVGTQGATVRDAMAAGANRHQENALIAVSRDILYASSERDYARVAGQVARSLAAQTVSVGE